MNLLSTPPATSTAVTVRPTTPTYGTSSFAVHGNYVVFGTCLESHYGFGDGLAVEQFYYYNQLTAGVQLIAQPNSTLSAPNDM